MLFNSAFVGVGVADDLTKGIIDRLRSLPMYPSAVLIGRTLSDVARNVITFVMMLVVAFLVGFRFEGSLVAALGATALMFFWSYAFSCIQALVGLSVGSVEAAGPSTTVTTPAPTCGSRSPGRPASPWSSPSSPAASSPTPPPDATPIALVPSRRRALLRWPCFTGAAGAHRGVRA